MIHLRDIKKLRQKSSKIYRKHYRQILALDDKPSEFTPELLAELNMIRECFRGLKGIYSEVKKATDVYNDDVLMLENTDELDYDTNSIFNEEFAVDTIIDKVDHLLKGYKRFPHLYQSLLLLAQNILKDIDKKYNRIGKDLSNSFESLESYFETSRRASRLAKKLG